jgi:hypothetical protein
MQPAIVLEGELPTEKNDITNQWLPIKRFCVRMRGPR